MSRQQDREKVARKKAKKQKVVTAGFMATTLLIAIIVFALCFIIGLEMGAGLPI